MQQATLRLCRAGCSRNLFELEELDDVHHRRDGQQDAADRTHDRRHHHQAEALGEARLRVKARDRIAHHPRMRLIWLNRA